MIKNIILWIILGIAEGLWLNEVDTTGTKIFWHFSRYHFALLAAFLFSGYENKAGRHIKSMVKYLCIYILVQDAASHLVQGGFSDWAFEPFGYSFIPWYYFFLGWIQYFLYSTKKL